jgi:FkbM family methyltransferase
MKINFYFNKIKQYGFKVCFRKLVNHFSYWGRLYYSELGEDVILQHYCPQRQGFYVDIGAYHPQKISVTRMFYKKGWRGINIDPNPHSIRTFDRIRTRDININIGVSDATGELNYYYWGKHSGNNTFDKELYNKWSKDSGHGAKEIMKIKVDTLNNILDMNLPENTRIDFLTIDVEGFEFKILQALDYDKYSPKLILVEDLSFYDQNKDFMDFKDTELYKFLNNKGYIVVAKTWYTILFKKIE